MWQEQGARGVALAILCKLAQMRALWGPLTSHLQRHTIVHYFHSDHSHNLHKSYHYDRGYLNAFLRNVRFCNILLCAVLRIWTDWLIG